MLKRKKTVQKSIRFDEQLANDLEYLAQELERTQNDLVNIAVEDLIIENKLYFAKLIVEDYLSEFINGVIDDDELKVDNVSIKVRCSDDAYVADVKNKNGNEIVEEFQLSFDDVSKLVDELTRYVNIHVDVNSDDIQQYLRTRLDYK